MLALHHGRPIQLNLKDILAAFLEFREEVIVKRTRYDLKKAREKAHLYVGLAIAVANIDEIIALIRKAPDRQSAKDGLLSKPWPALTVGPLVAIVEATERGLSQDNTYTLSEAQALAILDLRLHRLTGLERTKIQSDLEEVAGFIQEYLSILADRERVLEILSTELKEVKDNFATPRKTAIEESSSEVDIEDLIQKEDMVVTFSVEGYIKRVPLATYRAQRRGGKGRSGMSTKAEDVVKDVIVASTHDILFCFSNIGKVYQLKTYMLPLGGPQAKGRPIVNILPLVSGETISTVLMIPQDAQEGEIKDMVFATSFGNVRRNRLSDFASIRGNGKIAMKLDEGEQLVSVSLAKESDHVILSTRLGKCIRFAVTDLRVFAGRDSNGVRGIRLASGDGVMGMAILVGSTATPLEREMYLKRASKLRQSEGEDLSEVGIETSGEELSEDRFAELLSLEEFILTVTERGFGKRSSAYEYRQTGRGGQGVDSIVVNARNGGVVASFPVGPQDQIILVSDQGQMIRCPVQDIRIAGRRTQGVTLFKVSEDEKVVAVSRVPFDESEPLEGDFEEAQEGLEVQDIEAQEEV